MASLTAVRSAGAEEASALAAIAGSANRRGAKDSGAGECVAARARAGLRGEVVGSGCR